MPRIRTIKPEFWTSEQVAECSVQARLLFLGMWNFCDDGGVHPASMKRLKMEIFPSDDLTVEDVRRLVDELITAKLVFEYESEGVSYLHVTGWKRHQKIEKPNYKYPKPPHSRRIVDDQSTTDRRPIDDHSPPEGKGREGKGYIYTPDSSSRNESLADEAELSPGSFESVDEDTLRTDARLASWFDSAKRFGVLGSHHDRLMVFAAAERAIRIARNPAAMFVATVRDSAFDVLSEADDVEPARRRIANLKRGPPSKTHELTPTFRKPEPLATDDQ